MNRILFLTDKYFPAPYANGNCVHSVAKSFLEAGWEVHVLAYQDDSLPVPDEKDGVKIIAVRPSLRLRFLYYAADHPQKRNAKLVFTAGRGLSMLGRSLHWKKYPLSSESFLWRIKRKTEYLHSRYHYQMIVSAYNPIEAVAAGLYFKRHHKDVFFAVYHLDYMPEAVKRHISRKKAERAALYWEDQVLEQADLTLVLQDNYRLDLHRRGLYREKKEKVAVTDIPLMHHAGTRPLSGAESGYLEDDCENWVYAGSMSGEHYDPRMVFEIFLKLPDDKRRVLHIFGRGTWMPFCEQYAKRSAGRIACHPYVEHDELVKIFNKADVLVSIKSGCMLSGKVSEYIASGKHAVHFSGCIEDPDRKYFEKYSKGYVVEAYTGERKANAQKLYQQLKAWERGEDILPNYEEFEMNYPEYTRDILIKAYEKWAAGERDD